MLCSNCKLELKEGSIYCHSCGHKQAIGDTVPESNQAAGASAQKFNLGKIGLAVAILAFLAIVILLAWPRANISYDVLSIPDTVEPGENITITAEVENSGRAAGSFLLALSVEGQETETREIIVQAGEKEVVTFNVPGSLSPGNYQIGLNEWEGNLKVLKPAEFYIENFTLTPGQVQIGEETTISARIINRGEIAGSYSLTLLVDGESLLEEEIELKGDAAETFTYKFSKEEPGQYAITLNEQRKNLKVLKPADTKVNSLTLSPSSIKPGQTVTVTVEVTNSGDVEGDHSVSLTVGGKVEQSRTIKVKGNSSEKVSFTISRDTPGNYTVKSGGVSKTLTVMRIERPANGAIITSSMMSGQGELTITNGRSQDALVVLTSTTATNKPLLAVYVRANSSTTVRNISDRTYNVFFSHGDDWDKSSNKFTRNVSHTKFNDTLQFVTTMTEYTIWQITVHAVAGGTAGTQSVSPGSFPSPQTTTQLDGLR